jgi:hypothetical protein
MVGLLAGSYFKNKKPQENQYLGVEFGGDEIRIHIILKTLVSNFITL